MDIKQLLDNVKKIHRINFQDIINIDGYDENFAFNDKYYDIVHPIVGNLRKEIETEIINSYNK